MLDTNCLDGMSDVHCHLLPDVDDGSFSVANTLEMLDYLEHEVGFKRMYFTPHVMEDFSKNNRAYLTGRFDSFLKEYKGSVQLSLASEYMLDARFKDHLDEGLIITAFHEEEIEQDGRRIRILPAWKWLKG